MMEYASDRMTEQEHEEIVIRARRIQQDIASVAIQKTYIQMDPRQHWDVLGLCAQVGPDPFYLDRGGSSEDAKKICAQCEVQPDCLGAALATPPDQDFGIWGGTTKDERVEIRKQREAAK